MLDRISKTPTAQRALVVGISNYPKEEDQLPAVAADIREMAKVLSSKNGVFPSTGVVLLADKQATRNKILAALKEALSGTTAETVFVYLAGHGFESGGSYYFVAHDSNEEDTSTAVELAEIKTLFDQSKCGRAFLWLDFCHAGGILKRGKLDEMSAIKRGIGVVSGHGKVIVAACTSRQKSYESPSLGHGFFTHALLRGLRGEAKSAHGEVTAHSLYEFIDHEVANSRQQPVFFGETTGRIVLMDYGTGSQKDETTTKRFQSAKSQESSRKVSGTWVMLGDNFLLADVIRNHSDGNIELVFSPQNGDDEAIIAALRPTQYGSSGDFAFAANNDAFNVRVEELLDETASGKRICTLRLKSAERHSNFGMEMTAQGVGPDEIARLRAGRLLLNNPPADVSSRHRGYDQDSLVEGFISGSISGLKTKECVIRSIYAKYGKNRSWKDFARLKAIYLMKMSGTVEHVIELKIGVVKGGRVSVSFRGRRSHRYSNVEPVTIEIQGECILT